ncbi:hypothetical protein ACFL6W_03085 [Thermodesulfobacteriota bacterium]
MKNIIIIIAVIIILVIGGVIFLISNIDSVIKKGVETVGPKILKAPVTLNDVNVSVTKGTATITGLIIGNPEGFKTDYAFKLGEVALDLDIKSVTSDKIHIRSLIIDSPEIMYEGALGKNNNLSRLQSNVEEITSRTNKEGTDEKDGGSEGDSGGESKKIQIDYIKISGAKVNTSLDILMGKGLTVNLPVIELRDIGKNSKATVSDAVKLVLDNLNSSVYQAVKDKAKGIVNIDGAKELKDNIGEKAKEGIDKLKGLLGR